MSGTDLRTVAELMGHKSLQMVMRYAHLAPEHKAAAVARLDDFLTSTNNRAEGKDSASVSDQEAMQVSASK